MSQTHREGADGQLHPPIHKEAPISFEDFINQLFDGLSADGLEKLSDFLRELLKSTRDISWVLVSDAFKVRSNVINDLPLNGSITSRA